MILAIRGVPDAKHEPPCKTHLPKAGGRLDSGAWVGTYGAATKTGRAGERWSRRRTARCALDSFLNAEIG